MNKNIHSHCAVISVGFESTTLEISEGGETALLVLAVSGELQRPVDVQINTQDGTAMGNTIIIYININICQYVPSSPNNAYSWRGLH